MVGTDADITERKLAENALRESEERYRSVLEQSKECIFLVELESRRLIETNPALEKLLGYTQKDLL